MLIIEQNAKRKSPTDLNLNKVIALISINLSIHTVKTMQCSFTFDHFQIYFVAITSLNMLVDIHGKIKALFFFSFHLYILFYGMTNGIFVSLFNFVSLFMFLLYLMYIKHKKCLHTGAFTN